MDRPDAPRLSRVQRWLVGIVASGAVAIAGIGFAGSYAAVRRLALAQGFGQFAQVFPVGVDAGIVVLLALDLLLTWLRIPFPLLRYTAWLLTVATIAFNGAAAWPDPIGVGMHGIIPVLFVVTVEAARHATGRIADITADKAMDSIRISRWVLAPWPTFRLWRRMKLWEIRSYDEVVAREQARLVYRAQLIAEHGWGWRWNAPIEARMPLRLARYGIPVSAPGDAPGEVAEALPEITSAAPTPALEPATEAAPETPRPPTTERHEPPPPSASEAPRSGDVQRHESVTEAAPPAPVKAPPKRSGSGKKGDARDAIKALYAIHGRRPLEGEMVAELKRIKWKFTSRAYANKIRAAIEHDYPELAALGSDNVRVLTG